MTTDDFLPELKARLQNKAVPDSSLRIYINSAMRAVRPQNYSHDDYIEQVLDTACESLRIDNKFPEITATAQNGLTTSFAANDPNRFKDRIADRRAAMLIGKGAGC